MVIRMRDPHEVIKALSDRTDVLIEGGPTLAGAFLRAGVIDRILAYIAPILLGGPITAIDDVGVLSIAHAQRWRFDGISPIGPDILHVWFPNSRIVVDVERTVLDQVADSACAETFPERRDRVAGQRDVGARPRSRRTGHVKERAELAEVVAGICDPQQLLTAPGEFAHDLDFAIGDDVDAVAHGSFLEQHLALLQLDG